MKFRLLDLIFWVIIPLLNFFVFYNWGRTNSQKNMIQCDEMDKLLMESLQELEFEQECELVQSKQCAPQVSSARYKNFLEFHETLSFEKYRSERLADMNMDLMIKTYVAELDTAVLRLSRRKEDHCTSINQHLIAKQIDSCFAVAYIGHTNRTSYAIARHDQDINHYGLSLSHPDPSQIDKYSKEFPLTVYNEGKKFPTGFFRKVPKERGRERTKDKLGIFLQYFREIESDLDVKLRQHGVKAGDDLVVMVVNEGEIDLFLNFACSCRKHGISLSNVMVFAGSAEVVSTIEAMGAMAMYHQGYAFVNKKASTDYLDRVFVDMMWYKAFSVYLILRRRINVLFQDVDLVWFHDPMPYFHKYLEDTRARSMQTGAFVEAYFSDDGQRSMRYTPFYANSGFYYLVASPRSEYFAWSVMIAMDAIQVLGSHQNVFTTRLVEGLALGHQHTKILSLEEFPTGIMYHHNRDYMKRMRNKEVQPFCFHM